MFADAGIFAYFVVQDVRSVDLHKALKVSKVFPNDVLQLVVARLGLAIQLLHFKGSIHRDVEVCTPFYMKTLYIFLSSMEYC